MLLLPEGTRPDQCLIGNVLLNSCQLMSIGLSLNALGKNTWAVPLTGAGRPAGLEARATPQTLATGAALTGGQVHYTGRKLRVVLTSRSQCQPLQGPGFVPGWRLVQPGAGPGGGSQEPCWTGGRREEDKRWTGWGEARQATAAIQLCELQPDNNGATTHNITWKWGKSWNYQTWISNSNML